MALMFSMMNEARIGVGLCAAAIGYTGYLESLAYARQRVQGARSAPTLEPAGDARRAPRRSPDAARAEVLRRGALSPLVLLAARRLRRLGDRCPRTPSSRSRRAARAADAGREELAVAVRTRRERPRDPVLGGRATRDFDVELHYRDNRLEPDPRGRTASRRSTARTRVLLDGGKALGLLVARIAATSGRARATGAEGTRLADRLDACGDLVGTTAAPSARSATRSGCSPTPRRT